MTALPPLSEDVGDESADRAGERSVGDRSEQARQADADCSDVLHRIYEYLDGEMGPRDVARIAFHLGECGPCLAQHDFDRALKAAIHRAARADVACPDQLRVKVVRRITMVRIDLER